jgi:hypothetical protein
VMSLAVYHTSAAAAAKKLRSLADELTFKMETTLLKKKRVGSGVSAGGTGLATVAGIAGFFLTGPLIPAALVVGGVVSASGLAVSIAAGREAEANRKCAQDEVERMFQELEKKLTKIQVEIQHLVGGSQDDDVAELDQLLVQLREDMADPMTGLVRTEQIPRLANLWEILNNLRWAYNEIPEDWRQTAQNNLLSLWHAIGPLVPVGLSVMADGGQAATVANCKAAAAANIVKEEPCSHRYFAACDKGKQQHVKCYSTGGKVLYMAGLAVNVLSTAWSVYEVHSLTNKLKELEAMEASKGDRSVIYRGIAAHLNDKAVDLETRLKFLFNDVQLDD